MTLHGDVRNQRTALVARTVLVVVGLYDLLLLWPATRWLEAHAFAGFRGALPAPTEFMVDAQWYLVLLVLVTHGSAAAWAQRRFGLAAGGAAILFSGSLTAFWVWAMGLPFFATAGAIK